MVTETQPDEGTAPRRPFFVDCFAWLLPFCS